MHHSADGYMRGPGHRVKSQAAIFCQVAVSSMPSHLHLLAQCPPSAACTANVHLHTDIVNLAMHSS